MTGTKAYYQEHERSTLANLNGELQARETGHAEGYKVVQTDDGTNVHFPSTDSDTILVDGQVPFPDAGGRLSGTSAFTYGTANSTVTLSSGTFTTGRINGAEGTYTGGLKTGGDINTVGNFKMQKAQCNTVLDSTTASNPSFITLTSNSGTAQIAKEGSGGADFMSGGSAGALQLVSVSNLPVEIGVNAAKVAMFDASGLTIIGDITASTMASGTTQSDAGVSAGVMWFDTDDDNTIKMGV